MCAINDVADQRNVGALALTQHRKEAELRNTGVNACRLPRSRRKIRAALERDRIMLRVRYSLLYI